MGVGIEIRLDTHELTERMQFAARETMNALRRAVDRTARAARKEAIATMAADIGRPKSAFSKAVPPVKTTTQSSLTATWTISKAKIGILGTGALTPIRSPLQGSFSGSTFRLTGGGSAHLNVPKAFVIQANGGRVLMVRTGRGKKAIKAIYAESPNTGMAQDDGAPRKQWQKIAARELPAQAGSAMQAILDGQAVATTSGDAG